MKECGLVGISLKDIEEKYTSSLVKSTGNSRRFCSMQVASSSVTDYVIRN